MTGRCYCGAVTFSTTRPPQTVAYCHCNDCRRVSGAPVSALAAFAKNDLVWSPELGAGVSHNEGVKRWFCQSCGSPLAAWYAYLPDQIYVPVGLFDNASELAPESHSHGGSQLAWLHMSDDLPRSEGSNRDALSEAAQTR
ncbi:GFA family protein [Marivita hallyeonensis]|uniref:GFA family protein n=1 Tax=Marivita hallyeonensis TaxID=996342 RepID=UPI0009FE3E81|nr:GFA family protein [Marivita hallyeonensis]